MNDICLGGAAVVKNESDIIEAFVRHNLRFLDQLKVVDNYSTDGTYEILQALAEEGLPVLLSRDERQDHPQADVMSSLLQQWKEPCDWVFCLDADEFIDAPSVEAFRDHMVKQSGDHCLHAPWVFFVPCESDDYSLLNPLERITHRRAAPIDPWLTKVVVPRRFLNQTRFNLRAGNHLLEQSNGEVLAHRRLEGINIAHFPIRSIAQFTKKVICGDWAISARAKRSFAEGEHWRNVKTRIMGGKSVSLAELESLAYHYASFDEKPTAKAADIQLVSKPILKPDFQLQYSMRYTGAAEKNLIHFADRHFDELRHTALDCGATRVAKTRFGPMAYQRGDVVIGRSLAEYGEWAGPEIDFLLDLLQFGDTVVDVGANIGTHAIAMARRVGSSGEVIAFEPQRPTFHLLCANIALNALDNIRAERVAVGRRLKVVEIPAVKTGNIGNVGHADWGRGEKTPLLPLDHYKFAQLKLIKIDVEGMELAVLEGAKKTIKRLRPWLFIENNIQEYSERLIAWLFGVGYRCWWHLEPYFNEENFYGNRHNFLQGLVDRPEINMLCLPKGVDPPDGLIQILSPHDSWKPVWEAQGYKGTPKTVRYGIDPVEFRG